jgi:hypothetical protein
LLDGFACETCVASLLTSEVRLATFMHHICLPWRCQRFFLLNAYCLKQASEERDAWSISCKPCQALTASEMTLELAFACARAAFCEGFALAQSLECHFGACLLDLPLVTDLVGVGFCLQQKLLQKASEAQASQASSSQAF